MQIEIQIDESFTEIKVIVQANAMTGEVNEIMEKLSKDQPKTLVGYHNESLEILKPDEIIRIYSANQKVIAQTRNKEYLLRQRLYEMEEMLDKRRFVRISNSEIINLNKVVRMDLSLSGTIHIRLEENISTYTSRRYVNKIKQILGIR